MAHRSPELPNLALPLPLTQQAQTLADRFARRQPTLQKATQVRLNTLAVCVVNDYLQMMGIPTDLSVGDSWNPVTQLGADIADLEILCVGRLECRPVLNSLTYTVPPEVWADRIGYVVVQIDEVAQEARLLGFVEQAAYEEALISELRSPEALLDHLDRLIHPMSPPIAPIQKAVLVNLSQWLQNSYGTGWQTVESLLNPTGFTYGFRSRSMEIAPELPQETIRRAKLIDLNIQMPNPVALVMELTPESEQRTAIRLQVHPINQTYLPPYLHLAILDESGATFLEAQSREADNYIQLQFSGAPGEPFRVQVTIAEASVIESFVI
ncbi:MAG: DUF1822 family protein [Leptolyngbyaceae cyanobacterium CRU_2_3]|nr:DUF1822 family protein [Leptolyngbyaceae cyanobacterium CRU_2_3]